MASLVCPMGLHSSWEKKTKKVDINKSSTLFELRHELHYMNYAVCNKDSRILFSIRHQHQHGHTDNGSYVKGEFIRSVS